MHLLRCASESPWAGGGPGEILTLRLAVVPKTSGILRIMLFSAYASPGSAFHDRPEPARLLIRMRWAT